MTLLAAAAGNSKALWFATRGTGVVALLLLSASVVLGTLSSARWRGGRVPRFLVGGLHRNLTLLAVAFIVVHVVTTVLDRFAPIGFKDAIVPFLSPYRPIWLGLGAVAFDLVLALVITSLVRVRLGLRTWRLVHWLAYASFPVALLHAVGTGSDARFTWLALVGFGCAAAVVAAVLLRIVRSTTGPGARVAALGAALAVPVALLAFYFQGPARSGWAARAGTPSSLLPRAARTKTRFIVAGTQPSLRAGSFAGHFTGTLRQTPPEANGLVRINIVGAVDGSTVQGKLRITLWGQPTQEGGVALAASDVAFAAEGTTRPYVGNVSGLDGSHVNAALQNGAGSRVGLSLDLQLNPGTHNITATVHGRAA